MLVIFIPVYSCLDVFYPQLDNKSGLLVIDALITDESRSYDVYISRSVSALTTRTTMVKGATVKIYDDSGNQNSLQEIAAGHYITDSKKFTGVVGKKYVLYIKTSDGSEYRSDTCKMYGTSSIDQVYFRKTKKFAGNGTDELTGISFFIDGHVTGKENCYLRWDYTEDWKIVVPYVPEYAFSAPNTFTPIPEKNKICWKKAKSTDILIHSFQDQSDPIVREQEVGFMIPNQSDRFNERYSILVNQYAISRKEYDFWNQLKQTTEEGGSIFERQPYSLSGNIKNIGDPKEAVLGYFQVASISSKRLYIDAYQIGRLYIPLLPNTCDLKTYRIGDTVETIRFRSFSDIYGYIITRDSILVKPSYSNFGILNGMIVSAHRCTDCAISGDPKKPLFWIE
jgi:hypothetical protein